MSCFNLPNRQHICHHFRSIKTEDSWEREGNRYSSDLFSLLGTIILWVFWPSFNGLLAVGAARHRAVINTYLR